MIRGVPGRAFTLIEMLVVTAIVALLLAVLLPSLAAARAQGKRAACASNLRQMGTAWAMYDNTYGGYFPEMVNGHWVYGGKEGWLAGYTTRKRPLNPMLTLKQRQAGSGDVFHCPSDIGDRRRAGWSYFDAFGTSYAMNYLLVGSSTIAPRNALLNELKLRRPRMSRTRATVASGRLLFGGDGPWLYAWHKQPDLTTNWHRSVNGYNLLFLDGHAAFLTLVPGEHVVAGGAGYTVIPFRDLQSMARDYPNDYLPVP